MAGKLDRRTFLKTTGLALAAGAWTTGAAHAANSKAAHGLRKAVKYSMVSGKASVREKFALLKELGFEGVDMTSPLDHDEVRRAQDETGLIVHGVVSYDHWRKPLSDPNPEVRAAGLESFLGAIRDAKAYGGTSVLLVPAVVNKEVSYADAYKRSQAEIRKAIPLAEELGIQILIENVWNNFLLSPLELVRYLDELESPLVGSYFDVGNVVRYGWPEQWIRTLGHRVKKLDIKEFSREKQNNEGLRKGFQVELGEGDCDWPAVMKALSDIGFKGWATAEVRGGDAKRLRDISERMDRIFSSGA